MICSDICVAIVLEVQSRVKWFRKSSKEYEIEIVSGPGRVVTDDVQFHVGGAKWRAPQSRGESMTELANSERSFFPSPSPSPSPCATGYCYRCWLLLRLLFLFLFLQYETDPENRPPHTLTHTHTHTDRRRHKGNPPTSHVVRLGKMTVVRFSMEIGTY